MKKLLVATSALVVAAPAFADVTLSGKIKAKATTENGEQLSAVEITTLTVKVAYEANSLGGDVTFGATSSPATVNTGQISAYNVYADTSIGKFNIGTSDGYKTDDDLTELSFFNDDTGKNVDMIGVVKFAEAGLGNLLTYSNSFGNTDVALTWGHAAILSVGSSFNGFTVNLDTTTSPVNIVSNGSIVATNASPYVLNVSGDAGPVNVALESGYNASTHDNDGLDLKLSYDAGTVTASLGFGNNGSSNSDVTELQVKGSAGDISYTIAAGENQALNETSFSGFNIESAVGSMKVGLDFQDYNNVDKTELYVIPMDGIEIEFVDASNVNDSVINFKINTSF